jgi:hypothetical protein
MVARFMDRLGLTESLDKWDRDTVHKVVDAFLDERFPTIIASIK